MRGSARVERQLLIVGGSIERRLKDYGDVPRDVVGLQPAENFPRAADANPPPA